MEMCRHLSSRTQQMRVRIRNLFRHVNRNKRLTLLFQRGLCTNLPANNNHSVDLTTTTKFRSAVSHRTSNKILTSCHQSHLHPTKKSPNSPPQGLMETCLGLPILHLKMLRLSYRPQFRNSFWNKIKSRRNQVSRDQPLI